MIETSITDAELLCSIKFVKSLQFNHIEVLRNGKLEFTQGFTDAQMVELIGAISDTITEWDGDDEEK